MPTQPLRPCTYPGCVELVDSGRCPRHRCQAQRQLAERRGSASARGYDRDWEAARRAYLAEHPFCEIQQKCNSLPIAKRLAVVVDHKAPISKGGARLDPANFQSACWACHSWKTAVVDGGFGKVEPMVFSTSPR